MDNTIIIDNGTNMIKSGFAGDHQPRSIFPPIVGYPKNSKKNLVGSKYKDTFIGDEAYRPRSILGSNQDTIERGKIVIWDEVEKIWSHLMYNELRVKPENFGVLLSESLLTTKTDKTQMTEIFFEKFKVSHLALVPESILSLYSIGFLDGVVVDCGGGLSSVVPVVNGDVSLKELVKVMKVGGDDITKSLATRLMQINGLMISNRENRHDIEQIKKEFCFVPPKMEDKRAEDKRAEQIFILPDGKKLNLDKEIINIGEALFNPYVIGLSSEIGIFESFQTVYNQLDENMNRKLFSNTLLCGGSSLFTGFLQRFKNESEKLCLEVNFTSSKSQQFASFTGGSVLASLSVFKDQLITREKYLEGSL